MFGFQAQYDPRAEFARFSDFDELPNWLEALNDGATGTNTLNDAACGTYSIVTAAADNDYHYLASKSEVWRVRAGKPIQFGCRLTLTEANTDDANIVVGLSSVVAAGIIANDGAGPIATASNHVLFYKVDGGTVWNCQTSNSTTRTTTTSAATFTSGTAYELSLIVNTASANDTVAEVQYFINGSLVATHDVTISGLDEMHMLIGVKAGGANAETLIVDWVGARQVR